MMWNNIMLGLTGAALLCFVILAFMGTTVSAWYVVLWILPSLVDQINERIFNTI
jgi:hypothetical protein